MINDITKEINSPLCLFADDCLLYSVINGVENTNRLQENLKGYLNWKIPGNSSLMLANVLLYAAQDP